MSPTISAGAVLAGYRLERPLGEGGMGMVREATCLATGERVALKLLKRALEPHLRKRFLREARAASAVAHPSVRQVREVLEIEGDQLAMVMELLVGESLAERLDREGSIPLDELAGIALAVVSAVGTAHALGIVHRDLKPANVFLTEAPARRVLVLDFGIAKLLVPPGPPGAPGLSGPPGAGGESTAITGEASILGTPCYMSPEQAFGDDDIDHRADIWSLGVVLYQALTGVLPTRADNLGQVLKIVLTRAIPELAEVAPELPAELTGLVDRMLSRARGDRPQSLAEVAEVLGRYTSATAPSFDPPATRAAPSRSTPAPADGEQTLPTTGDGLPRAIATTPAPRRASPTAKIVGAIAAALLVAGGVAFAARASRPTPPALGSAAATERPRCTKNLECAWQSGESICRKDDGECVALGSVDCQVHAEKGDIANDATIWIGAMFPRTGDAAASYGTPNLDAIELARRDFVKVAEGLPSPRADRPARPLAFVACDDVVDADRAARHLVDDLHVPAVIGFRASNEVIHLATSLFIPKRVMAVAAINHSALITGIPHPPGQPRYVWRIALGSNVRAEPVAAIIASYIEPRLRAAPGGLGPTRPMKAALIRRADLTGLTDQDALLKQLRYNGKSIGENGASFREIVVTEATDAGFAKAAASALAYRPDVVVIVEQQPNILEAILAGSPRRAPPYLVALGAWPDEPGGALLQHLGATAERRERSLGVSTPTAIPANVQFTMAFNQAFEPHASIRNNPAPSYDAFYLIAYAAYALGDEPVTGEGLSRAMGRLVPPGDRVDVGPARIFDALRALHDGRNIDLEGASSKLDFDLTTGESAEDFVVLCVGPAEDGKLDSVESGLVYSARDKVLRGTLRCP